MARECASLSRWHGGLTDPTLRLHHTGALPALEKRERSTKACSGTPDSQPSLCAAPLLAPPKNLAKPFEIDYLPITPNSFPSIEAYDDLENSDSLAVEVRHSGALPRLHFRDSGAGDVACFFIHGFGEGCFVWHECAAEMASLVRVVAVDLRGHGDSERDEQGRYDVASYVSDVLAVVSLLRMRRFILVGHSLGGEIALEIAVQLGEKIAALVLVDFSPEPDPMGASQVLLDFDADNRLFKSRAEYRNSLSQRRPLAHPTMLDRYADCALSETSDGKFRLKRDPNIKKSGATLPSGGNPVEDAMGKSVDDNVPYAGHPRISVCRSIANGRRTYGHKCAVAW